MPTRKRILSVIRLALGGPANASLWNWWGLVVWAVTVVVGVFGRKIPHVNFSHATWIAIFLGVTSLLLLRAAVQLHKQVDPDFPLHLMRVDRPMYMPADSGKSIDNYLLVDLSYTNRTAQPVNLDVELWWIWEKKVRRTKRKLLWKKRYTTVDLGPYRCRHRKPLINNYSITGQPIKVTPYDTLPDIKLCFDMDTAVGVEESDYDVVLKPGVRLFFRLTDHVTGAMLDTDWDIPEPLSVITARLAAAKTERTAAKEEAQE